jgi:thymidylate synthase (FAD)|tara:strand:- start:6690 stop:7331 length:642 start_codon:yes stop_codon:yes gene_type:complete
MEVKLVSLTKPDIEGVENAEDIIAYCARVSNPSNQMNTETAPRLIKYLIKHKHWSPFELASMCVEIKTSRAIAAQILRHRSFSFQEFSQRYSQALELEDLELRSPAEKNRQSSSEKFPEDSEVYRIARASMETAMSSYKHLIELGVAKECARAILPLNTETTMYMNGTVRSWVHYIDLRAAEDTQKEHREIAESIKNIFINKFPNTSEALGWK